MDRLEQKTFYGEGMALSYLIFGSGEPILFLHGDEVRASTYARQLTALAARYRVICPDLPGFGDSSTPIECWRPSNYAEFLGKFLDSLRPDKIALIGHSFGGAIALNLAARDSRISKLILIDSTGKRGPDGPLKYRLKLYFQKTLYDLFVYKKFGIFYRIALDFFANRIKKFYHWRRIVKIAVNFLYCDFSGFDKIKIPTLILWGEDDELIPVDHGRYFHENIRGSKLVLVPGNHDWLMFQSDDFVRRVADWLAVSST